MYSDELIHVPPRFLPKSYYSRVQLLILLLVWEKLNVAVWLNVRLPIMLMALLSAKENRLQNALTYSLNLTKLDRDPQNLQSQEVLASQLPD